MRNGTDYLSSMKQPSSLDMRVARHFQSLAPRSRNFSLTCEFCSFYHPLPDQLEHRAWAKGKEAFQHYFGNATDYFIGACEYINLKTGWSIPKAIKVVVLNGVARKVCGGIALKTLNEIKIRWTNSEFTLTVFHELIHLFKKEWSEAQVEQKALELMLGL